MDKEKLINEATSTVSVLDDLIRAAKKRQARLASNPDILGTGFFSNNKVILYLISAGMRRCTPQYSKFFDFSNLLKISLFFTKKNGSFEPKWYLST